MNAYAMPRSFNNEHNFGVQLLMFSMTMSRTKPKSYLIISFQNCVCFVLL